MTVQELIDQLEKVDDKSKNVCIEFLSCGYDECGDWEAKHEVEDHVDKVFSDDHHDFIVITGCNRSYAMNGGHKYEW